MDNINFFSIRNNTVNQSAIVFRKFANGYEDVVMDLTQTTGTVLLQEGALPLTYGDDLSGTAYDPIPKTFLGWYFRIFISLMRQGVTTYIMPEAIISSYNALDLNDKRHFCYQYAPISDSNQFMEALKAGILYYDDDGKLYPALEFGHKDVQNFLDHLIWKTAKNLEAPVLEKPIQRKIKKWPWILIFMSALGFVVYKFWHHILLFCMYKKSQAQVAAQ